MAVHGSYLFPMMCYSKEDKQLWQDDPYEYMRMKFISLGWDLFKRFPGWWCPLSLCLSA